MFIIIRGLFYIIVCHASSAQSKSSFSSKFHSVVGAAAASDGGGLEDAVDAGSCRRWRGVLCFLGLLWGASLGLGLSVGSVSLSLRLGPSLLWRRLLCGPLSGVRLGL